MYIWHWIIIAIKHILASLHLIHFVQIFISNFLILFRLFIVNDIKYFICTYIAYREILKVPLFNWMRVVCLILLNICVLKWSLNGPVQIRIILVFFWNNILLVLNFKFSIFIKHLIRYIAIKFLIGILCLLRAKGLSLSSLSHCMIFISILIFIVPYWLVGRAYLLNLEFIGECI